MNRFQDYLAKRQPGQDLAEAAIALGVPVFACLADKKPATEHGFHDATMDPAAIRAMFAKPGAALIGVPTGSLTWIVVDVDSKENRQGKDWLQANSHRMPQTRTIRTASGGLHIYFLHPGQRVKNQNDKIAPGIDVRGDGGYVIVPPSAGYAVADDAPIADVPDWLLPALCPPETVHQPAPSQRSAPTGGNTPYGLAGLAGECEAIRIASFGTQESTLNAAGLKVGALIAGGELAESYAMGELLAEARSIPSQPGKPAWSQSQIEQKVRRAVSDGMRQPRSAEPWEPEMHPAAAFLAKLYAPVTKNHARPLPVAPGIMDVEGPLRLFVDHCEATAISSQPFLALAAGICMVGAIAGRRYRTRTDLRSNIYAVGIADSGGGKDHARKRIKAVLGAADLVRYMGGEDIASGSAIMTALHRHPAILFQIDEFGDWLSNVLGPKAAAHKKQIAERLKTLYSSADSYIIGTEYADQSDKGRKREDIHQPHACLYGTTTPGQFWAAIATGSLHDGLMARLLVFLSPLSYPDEKERSLQEPPAELIEGLQAIARGVGTTGNLADIMISTVTPEPYTVPETAETKAAIHALRAEQLAMQRQHEGSYVTAIAARWSENALKLALVRAVSRDPAAPVMLPADVAWGRLLTKHCIDTLLQNAERHIADTQHGRDINRALEIIRKHGPITERDLIRRGFKLNERDRTNVLKTLVDGGYVIALPSETAKTGGRPTIRYQVAPASNSDGNDETPFVIEKSQ